MEKLTKEKETGLKIASQYGKEFAFDGCHKIYILRTEEEKKEVKKMGYNVLKIEELRKTFEESCPLRFISSFDLTISFIPQD